MRSTAVQAVALAVLSQPASAQLAAGARPSGGQVTAGQASIGGNATTTLIEQQSQNAAIDWKTYNVGSGQTVQYAQPDASAITLNTVIAANPSQIAGRILANGQIIIVNQSGVVFAKGSQVDAAGLVVSSAGISNKDFMAGRLVFNQAGHPGASISNAGNITISQAGLAALVAPQVANSGVITARLGRVILGGATTHTLDLYGDGLVALNITGQVTQVSLNGRAVPALVTNTGTILAPGGTVVLTAAAADSVVTNLVSAGGVIAAPSLGAQTGRVLVQGIGGGVSIDGQVSAAGTGAGATGGQVVINATGNVTVSSGALIDASGVAGGGVIAVGTTAARATGGPSVHPKLTARTVNLAAGSRIQANATASGQGGRIAVLSTEKTSQRGNITATGGAAAGNGGWIEVSGKELSLGGIIDDGASHGLPGSILLDPANIVVGSVTGTGSHASTLVINPSTLGSYTGNVILDAAGTLLVNETVDLSSKLVKTFQLEGDEGIVIDAAINAPGIAVALKSAAGAITEDASGSIAASSISATAGGPISLTGQNVNTLIAPFSSVGTVASGIVAVLDADGFAIEEAASAANEIPALAGLVAGGDIAVSVAGTNGLGTANTLSVSGNIIGTDVALSVTGTGAVSSGAAFTQLSGTISALGQEIGTNLGVLLTPGTVQIAAAAGDISLAGRVLTSTPGTTTGPSGSITLTAQAGDVIEAGTGSIDTGTLTGGASGTGNQDKAPAGNANFAISAGNTVSTITGFTTSGNLALEDDTGLVVGTVTATAGSITIGGPAGGARPTGSLSIAGAVTAAGPITFSNGLGIAERAGAGVVSTGAGIALSTSGAITQAGTATLTGGEAAASGTAVSLSAGTGITLGGTITAGALSRALAYSGIAALSVADGNITENAGASIRAGTLTGDALSTATSQTASAGNANFAVSAGNTLATAAFTTGGSFALEDDTGLTLGNLTAGSSISVNGPASGNPSGILVIADAVKGGSSVLLGNALGIAELGSGSVTSTAGGVTLTSGGAIFQQAGGTLGGAEASSAGTALALAARGTTDFNTYLPAEAFGTISGLSLNGALSAGGLSAGAYTGLAVLTASAGNILEATGGAIHAGTLTGSAAGNALFESASGNILGTLTGFSATGDIALVDASGLTLGKVSGGGTLNVAGPAGANPTGILVIDGTVSAPGAITLGNALGIAELAGGGIASTQAGVTLATGGAIDQQAGASITSGEASRGGTALSLTANGTTDFTTFLPQASIGSVSGIAFGGTLTAGIPAGGVYGGLADLVAGKGSILEGASGSLRTGTLAGSASGAGLGNVQFAAGAGNSVATLTLFTAGGSFLLADDAQLQIGTLTAGGSIDVSSPTGLSPVGILSVAGKVQGGGDVTLGNSLGVAILPGSTVISTAGGVTLTSSGGGLALPAGTTLSGGAASSAGAAISLTAGGATDFNTYLPSAALGTVAGMTLGGVITAGTATAAGFTGEADLITLAGNVTESAGASLQAGTLTGSTGGFGNPANAPEGNVLLGSSTGNTIGSISQLTAYGSVSIQDASGVAVGNVTAGGSISVFGPDSLSLLPAGIMTVTGTLAAPGDISLENALGIAELAGARIASSGAEVSLLTNGAFDQQAGASIGGGLAASGGIALSIAASGTTDFNTFLPAAGLGTVSGLSFGGTLAAGTFAGGAYTGAANLTASAGQILEGAAGSLRAGTLFGSAGGNALLDPASGNSLGTLGSFSAGGNFALEDDGGLAVDAVSAGGSVGIAGPARVSPSGILVVAGSISAGGSIGLSNALGIAELADASVFSTLGGVALTSGGGAIAQLAGATLSAGAGAADGATVQLSAGGSTNFATFLPSAGLGTVQGIQFAGTLQSGKLSGTAYAGGATLSASAGTIVEEAGGHILAGTLSGSAQSASAASGNAEFGVASGNSVSVLAGFTTSGGFTLENDTALTVAGPVTAGTTIDIFSPAQATSAPGILIIAGSLTAASSASGDGTISLSNGLGILETGTGAVLAGNALALASGGAIVQLASGILRVAQPDAASGIGTVSLTASGSTDFAPYAPYAAFGTVGGIDLGGVLAAGATVPLPVTASAPGGTAILVAKAGDITETAPDAASATGSIFAGRLTAQAGAAGGAAYSIDLGNGLNGTPTNAIGTLFGTDAAPLFASGSITIADDGILFGPSGSPIVALQGAVTALAGSLSVSVYGAGLDISQPGALPVSAGTEAVLRTTAGTLANGTVFTGSVSQSGGTIEAPALLIDAGGAFDQSAGATLSGTGGSGTISVVAGDAIAFGGTLAASGVSLTALRGDMTEVAQGATSATGVIQAMSLSATAQAGAVALDTGSSAATGNQVTQLGDSSAAGGFTLVDGQGLTVTGAVRAGLAARTPSALTIAAPSIDVSTGSLAIAPPSGTPPGILGLVADQFTFASAGDVQTPGGIVALDLLNASGNTVFSVGTAGTDTVAPSSLQNISAGTGTLAIGSLDGTLVSPQTASAGGWGIGSGGTVTAIDIDAPLDLQTGGSARTLGLFSNGSIDASVGITTSALYGIAAGGTALLTGANAISTLGAQTAGGALLGFSTSQAVAPGSFIAFQLVDDAPLNVLGPVFARQGAVNIAVIGTNGLVPGLTLGSTLAGSGRISGTDIDLSATAAISQVAGTLNAFGAPHGTIALQSTAGGISLAGTVAAGTFAGSTFTLDPAGAIVFAADRGSVAETSAAVLAAGTLAARASGDILLAAGTNTVDVIAPLTVGNLSVSGLAASGSNGIDFTDTGALLVADGATISAFGPAGTAGSGTGSIVLLLSAGGLTVGSSTGAIIAAPGDITLTAPGGMSQTGGVIDAGQDVTLISTAGGFSLTGGSIAGSNAVTLDFRQTIDLSANSTLAAPGTGAATSGTIVVASAGGSIVADGLIEAGGVLAGLFTPASGSAVLLSAGAGDIVQSDTGSIDAGTLAAAAPGNISLVGNNQVSAIGSLGAALSLTLPQAFTLYGLSAGGTSGIVFDDDASLRIGPDTGAHAVIEDSSATATLSIDEQGGSLVIGGAGASSLIAGGSVTLASLDSIFQDAGAIRSINAGVGLASGFGSVVLAGSTIDAATGVVISAGQDFDQSNGVIAAGGSFGLLAGGAVDQSAGGTIVAGSSISISTGLDAALNGQSSSFGDFIQSDSLIRAGTNLTIASVSAAPFSGTISQSSGATLAAGKVISLSSAAGNFSQDTSVITAPAGVTLSIYGNIASTNGVIESAGAANAPGPVAITSATGSMSSTGAGALIEAGTLALSAASNIVADHVIAGTLSGLGGGFIQMSGTNTISAITDLIAGLGPIDLADGTGLTVLNGGTIAVAGGASGITVSAASLALDDATVSAGGRVDLAAGGLFTQTGGVIESNEGNVAISGQSLGQTGNALIRAAQTVSIASAGAMTIDGTVQGGAVALSAGSGGIEAAGGSVLAGTLAASSAGQMDLSNAGNQIAEIGAAGPLDGLAATGPIVLADAQSLLVVAPVAGGGSVGFTIAGSFSDLSGVGITAAGALAIDAGDAVSIGGSLGSGPLTIASGGSFAERAGAGITVAGAGAITSGQAVTIDGRIDISGAADIAAATDLLEGTDGTISIPAPATLTAPGSITLDGLVSVPGSLTVIAGTDFSQGAGGLITAGSISIDAQTGTAAIGGTLSASGPLASSSGADIDEAASARISAAGTALLDAGGAATVAGGLSVTGSLIVIAGSNVLETPTATIDVAGSARFTSGLTTTIDGPLSASGQLSLDAFGNVTQAQGATMGAGSIDILSSIGTVAIGGQLTSAGTLGITARTGAITIDGALAAQGALGIDAAGGAVSIGGSLTSGAATIRGDGIDVGGVVVAGATQLTSGAGVTVEGTITAKGALGIDAATDLTEHQGASITGRDTNLAATAGDIAIDGALDAAGALSLTAGANIAQGAASTIAATTTADLVAPGAITLAGSLGAPGISIGDASTRDVVWDGNTIRTGSALRGATKAINVLAPLAAGSGVFVQSATFQQLGNSFVDPLTGGTATLQITVEGRGTAHFDELTAPRAQMLLVLNNGGFANGLIDVAGLNVYHTQGETPPQAANLSGVVGGRTGTAAAGVGFSHLNSNINYQINGCPIQSVDCILLSPVVVPVQDPVTDYAEGTQRRRHQDDDALPNVGEEDY